jgi:hypothetical protein
MENFALLYIPDISGFTKAELVTGYWLSVS